MSTPAQFTDEQYDLILSTLDEVHFDMVEDDDGKLVFAGDGFVLTVSCTKSGFKVCHREDDTPGYVHSVCEKFDDLDEALEWTTNFG